MPLISISSNAASMPSMLVPDIRPRYRLMAAPAGLSAPRPAPPPVVASAARSGAVFSSKSANRLGSIGRASASLTFRVDVLAVDVKLVVQVRAGRQSGHADEADGLSALDVLGLDTRELL